MKSNNCMVILMEFQILNIQIYLMDLKKLMVLTSIINKGLKFNTYKMEIYF